MTLATVPGPYDHGIDPGDFDVVDLFAGPGGWDVALRSLGLKCLGFEWDSSACATRAAEGHATVQGDLSLFVPWRFLTRGQIASPPCQGFSMAGSGKGRADSVLLLQMLADVTDVRSLVAAIDFLREHMTDERTLLVLEPLRWALTNRPEWLAWEQVPAVLPIWQACAVILRRAGYSVETGVLKAEQYGVPQTRKRAVLVGRSAAMTAELGPVALPQPTHSAYHNRTPDRLDEGVLPWVSMAQALGRAGFAQQAQTGAGALARQGRSERPERPAEATSFTITGAGPDHTGKMGGCARLRMISNAQPNAAVRHEDQPAPTITGGHDTADRRWVPDVNNQSGEPYDVDQQISTPAAAIAGRGLVPFRGANANRFNGSAKSRNDGVRVSVEEAAALQTFPGGYAWQGTKTQAYQQIGNAVPPLLALAVICAVIGVPFDPSLAVRA